MDKINQLLLSSLEKEKNIYEKTKNNFVEGLSNYIEGKFDGDLNFRFCVFTTHDKYSFGNYIESYKHEPKKIGRIDLRDETTKWIAEVIGKYPCFKLHGTEICHAEKNGVYDTDEMKRRRADNWEYEPRKIYIMKLDKDYVENLKKGITQSVTPGGPTENEDLIVYQFPCGICGESSDERVLARCGKKTYHASFCEKCYENANVVCAICNSKPDRTKCKIIRLK